MNLHVLQACIQIKQHFGIFLAPDKVACTRCIEPSRYRFQIFVKSQVLRNIIGKFGSPLLVVQQIFALALKGGRLRLDSFEGVGQVGEEPEGGIGAGQESVQMGFREKQLVSVDSANSEYPW